MHLVTDLSDESVKTLLLPSAIDSVGITTQPLLNAPSIVVLPFINLSADPENEYFCDELAGELIIKLSKIKGLKVAARASAFRFKEENVSLSEIGHILGVNSVLVGWVFKVSDHLRITVELDSVLNNYCLWSEKYDQQMKSIFDVLDEITLAIVEALKVHLPIEDRAALKRYTDNSDVYKLYLEGRYHFHKHTSEGWLKAIEYFEKAIEIEPEYALAHAGLSSVLAFPWFFGFIPPQEVIPKWKAATDRALGIDGNLDEAHVALAQIHFFYEWNWEEAEQEYKRAIELSPNNAFAHQQYGLFLAIRGRPEQAISEGRRAVELDRLSLFAHYQLGWVYFWINRYDDALGYAQLVIEMEPDFHGGYFMLGATSLVKGEYQEAFRVLEQSVALGGGHHIHSVLGHAYGMSGKQDEALDVLNQLLETRTRYYVCAMDIARIYIGLGENDKAFEWLEKAYEERNGEMVYIKLESRLPAGEQLLWRKDVCTDPRFLNLLQRVGVS